jgi:hypothetical protein
LSLAAPLISQLKQTVRQLGSKKGKVDFGGNSHESAELLRLLGALELLPVSAKQELGELFLEILDRPKFSPLAGACLWAMARVGARQPAYGPLNVVVPEEVVSQWIVQLSNLKLSENLLGFAMMQLARKTGDRYRDLDDTTRSVAVRVLQRIGASEHYRKLVTEVTPLQNDDQSLIFGDMLPKGLRIL